MSREMIIARLQSLQDAEGRLDPRIVIDDAKDPDSPLHECFEWDKEKAAESYWLIQARQLIRSVRLTVTEEKHQFTGIAYVRDPEKPEGEAGYISTITLRTSKDRSRDALISELNRAESALQRAYDVASTLGLQSEVESLLAQLRGIRSAA
jgi:hypothetical protein